MPAAGKIEHHKVVVIGAGPGGICAGIKLKAAGYEDFLIIEKSNGVGGTWYNTRYPGLTCDVKSHLYSFSFELNPHWTNNYAGQPEILRYMEGVAEKYGLMPHVRLGRKVTALRWDDAKTRWHVSTDDGAEVTADAVIAAQGMFNDLHWPEIEGLDSFRGTLFHASRWREDHDLTGERVAVIGSAASAVQFIPKIAAVVGHLTVFQRSAPWVAPKEDQPVSEEERERFARDRSALQALYDKIYDDLEAFITFGNPAALETATKAGLANIEAVKDPALREKMTPHVPFGCLRPLISNEYFPTFNRDNVSLVTAPIERIAANGVVTQDGVTHEVDTIICATGYHVRRYLSAIDVTGAKGRHLNDAWAKGAEAYLGIMTSGFPNLFMMYGPNTNNGSILFMLETQADFIVEQLKRMDRDGLAAIDLKPEVMARYNEALQDDLAKVGVWQASCSNYYRTPEGRIVTQWPHTMTEYRARCRSVDPAAFVSIRRVAETV